MKLTCVTAVMNAIESGNRENLIRCVKSVAALKTPHEHLIYDGGSTDGTVELLRELEEKIGGESGWTKEDDSSTSHFSLLTIHSEKDTGIYNALNKGVRDAKGEWFYVLGCDDFICRPEVLDRLMSSSDDSDIVATEVYRGTVTANDIRTIWFDKILWCTPYCHQGALMRTSLIRDVGGFDESYRIDADYKLMLTLHCHGAKVRCCTGEKDRFAVFGQSGLSMTNRAKLECEHARMLSGFFHLDAAKVEACRQHGYLPPKVFLRFLWSPDQALRICSRAMFREWSHAMVRPFLKPFRWTRHRTESKIAGEVAGLISVIVPVYNVEEYLADCLDSLRRQTYGHWEAICVDDGSTDGSLEILRRYAAQDSRIRFCEQENRGQSVARNRGRGMASGEYCHFLDADDMLREDAFEKCVSVMKAHGLDHLIFGTELLIDPRVAEKVDIRGYRDYYTVDESLLNKVSSGGRLFADLVAKRSFFVSPPLRLSRTDALPPGELFPSDAPLHEDNYSTPRILLTAARAMVIPDRLYIRRLRPQSCVTSEDPRRTHANAYLSVYRLLGPLCRRERDPFVARQLRAYRRFVYGSYCLRRNAPPSLVQRAIDAFRLEADIGSLFRRLAGFARRKLLCVKHGN